MRSFVVLTAAVLMAVTTGVWSVTVSPPAERLGLTVSDKGIALGAGNMGTFELAFPELETDGGEKLKPAETRVSGNTATLRYGNGGIIRVDVRDGKIALTFDAMPGTVTSYWMSMPIPFNYNQGGRWEIGDAKGDFPARKPLKPHLFQGHARTFSLTSVDNKHLHLGVPEYTYQQLTDNREWNWNIFWWAMKTPRIHDRKTDELLVSLDAAAARRVVLVDRFGQDARRDFPGKVRDEGELRADVAGDAAYYAGLMPPRRDRFGGLPGSAERLALRKTGFFHVERKTAAGHDVWILVDPDGNAFFHLGICGFGPSDDYTYVEGREDIYEWLPPRAGEFADAWHPDAYWRPRAVSFYKANVIRKYAAPYDDAEQLSRLIDRVRLFGFNSGGAFSGGGDVMRAKGIPRVATLPLGTWTLGEGVPGVRGVFDPFDDGNQRKMDTLFSASVASHADDPLLIGYFLDNEQAFEDIPRAVPALDGKHACKRELVAMLRRKYPEVAGFAAAWDVKTESFESLFDRGLPVTTKAAFDDMQAFTGHFLDTYYRTISETFHKYDRNHMLIGNRWQPGTANNELLCRTAGRYMDVISINYYTSAIDEAFLRRLFEWTGGRPQMWSEFYYTSEKESTVRGSSLDMATQHERGLAYRNYVEGAAALGFVVGVEWFTLIDQATTGRFFEKYNGERNNTGLFSVCDRPYKPMLEQMAETHSVLYDVWLAGRAPYRLDDPRFRGSAGAAKRVISAGHATGSMAIDGRLDGWPGRPPERIGGDRLALGRECDGLEASFKICWDEANLYVLANVADKTPMKNAHAAESLWSADGLELFIGSEKPEQGGTLLFSDRQILLGAGRAGQAHVVNAPTQPAIRTAVVPAVDGGGYTLEAAIPWGALDVAPRPDLSLLFDVGVDNSDDGDRRQCQLIWNGGARNSTDRGAWGRLVLVP